MKGKRFCGLVILDGYGLGEAGAGNAIASARTPNLDRLLKEFPHTEIGASGLDVGLPHGQIGNSEVGHLNLGAGRIVYQDITRIDKSIQDGDFFVNPAFLAAMENCKNKKSRLHLVGLLSDGGVHSTINHLFALLKMAKAYGLSDVVVHCLLDGRDVPPSSGKSFVEKLQKFMKEEGVGRIASVVGRYYFMDRDNRWERVEKGYNCMFAGVGSQHTDAASAVAESYEKGVHDEFVEPIVIVEKGKPVGEVSENDSIIFYNFRSDRAREISRAILETDFDLFERKKGFLKVCYVGMTQYDASFKGILTAFAPKDLKNTFGEYIAGLGYKQLRIAETEKYAHVTFFFNGGSEAPNEGEERVLVASPQVATYDLQPEMSAYEVTEKAVDKINSGELDTMILNYANCDMVGHTGVFSAAVKAVEVVDECVGKVVDAILKKGGALLICADHGNAELMTMPDGSPWTAHTTNLVPFILVDETRKNAELRKQGNLADVIPTLLELLEIRQPVEMEGQSLLAK